MPIISHRWGACRCETARKKAKPGNSNRTPANVHGCSRVLCTHSSLPFIVPNLKDSYNRTDQPYVPPTKPYELSELVSDLVLFSRAMLKPQGRLVFFLPTVTEEYEQVDIEAMMCDGMEVVANSLQDFGNWGRRVGSFHRTTSQASLISSPAYNDQEVHRRVLSSSNAQKNIGGES